MGSSNLDSVNGVVGEIMNIHRSLPTRPSPEEVEAAISLIQNVEKEEQVELAAISKERKGIEVSDELFFVLQEMQKCYACFKSKEQKREAQEILDKENIHIVFDEFVQRASNCLTSSPSSTNETITYPKSLISTMGTNSSLVIDDRDSYGVSSSGLYSVEESGKSSKMFTRDDSYVAKVKVDGIGFGGVGSTIRRPKIEDSSLKPVIDSGQEGEKLSPFSLASLIGLYAKKGTQDLNLQNKLLDSVSWLPDSLGKLSGLLTLDLSQNSIVTLPDTIGNLASLTKLDLRSNRISELPESIINMFSLVYLDISGNNLSSLPANIGKLPRLEELDVSSNHLRVLPESIGNLVSLKKLDMEHNVIEELPYTISGCSSLVELRADYNKLKALPEALGKLGSLEILSVRLNEIKQLPTTMGSMTSLREIDASNNELEAVPASLCFATNIVKLNVGNNFADLRSLPHSIGNLEMLEVLDISNNQIRVLPDSFRMLSRLRVLNVDQTPLEIPPRHIAQKGAQEVVQYMAEHVSKRENSQPVQSKTFCGGWNCFFKKSNKRQRHGLANSLS
ncbi:hypothetical protein GIB67_026717 [Kingdonia uniflora]|uniref:Disease resistance R13L4/SHOC-2-like LRR domain-containing protein n=1 Tax=Kingdonia uniflora TaxID=39325 RepID=A0A7J7MHC8_9MAGN|nr:hypothetical protein GIB67_026717 [Kingdonia uniflora]